MSLRSGWTNSATLVVLALFGLAVTGIFLVVLWLIRRSTKARSWLGGMKAEKPLVYYGLHLLLCLLCILVFFLG